MIIAEAIPVRADALRSSVPAFTLLEVFRGRVHIGGSLWWLGWLPVDVDGVFPGWQQSALVKIIRDGLNVRVEVACPKQGQLVICHLAGNFPLRISRQPHVEFDPHFRTVHLFGNSVAHFAVVVFVGHRELESPALLAIILLLEVVGPAVGGRNELVPVVQFEYVFLMWFHSGGLWLGGG